MGEPTLVAVAPGHRLFAEPSLTVHPRDPKHLLAATMVESDAASFEERIAHQTCAVFLSLDAGKTWRQRMFPLTRCFDPYVAINPDGRALFSVIARNAALEDGLFVFHSPDGGQTWDQTPLNLGRGFDHPTLAVDLQSQKRKGWFYLLSWRTIETDGKRRAALSVMHSVDGGKTFSAPTQVIPNNLVNLSEMPVLLSDGTLIVSFVEAARWVDRGLDRFDRWRAWVVQSIDGGESFSTPLFVTDVCGPPPGFQLSALAVDTAQGPFRDRLYFLCGAHNRGPLALTVSHDRGETWSRPASVAAPVQDSEPRRVIGLAVNKGVLVIGHLDQVSQTPDSCRALSLVASRDGGFTFLEPRRISIMPCAAFGDYFGMIAVDENRFRLLWPEMRAGLSRLQTAIVEVGPRPASERR